jgi:hypothetical protein
MEFADQGLINGSRYTVRLKLSGLARSPAPLDTHQLAAAPCAEMRSAWGQAELPVLEEALALIPVFSDPLTTASIAS